MKKTLAAAIFLATMLARPALAEPAGPLSERDLMRGKILYLQCRACHAVSPEEGEKIGPSLVGIFGRPAASLAGFNGYSAALKDSGIVWDESAMDRWLRDPAGLMPGNLMAYAGLASDVDRALLLRYLALVTGNETNGSAQ